VLPDSSETAHPEEGRGRGDRGKGEQGAGSSRGPGLDRHAPRERLALTDPTVSRRMPSGGSGHDGWVLRDHDSTNGTFLDDVRVREPISLRSPHPGWDQRPQMTFRRWRAHRVPAERGRPVRRLIGSSTAPAGGLTASWSASRPRTSTSSWRGRPARQEGSRRGPSTRRTGRADGPFVRGRLAGAVAAKPDRERALRPREGRLHRRGSRPSRGPSSSADSGTIFLDEIGELSLDLPAEASCAPWTSARPKRVRRGQAREGQRPRHLATNRDLEKEVKAGRSARTSSTGSRGAGILPPLRQAAENIGTLASHLLTGDSRRSENRSRPLARGLAALSRTPWPERAGAAERARRGRGSLRRRPYRGKGPVPVQGRKEPATFDGLSGKPLEEIEKAAIPRHAVRSVNGNKTEAGGRCSASPYSTLSRR